MAGDKSASMVFDTRDSRVWIGRLPDSEEPTYVGVLPPNRQGLHTGPEAERSGAAQPLRVTSWEEFVQLFDVEKAAARERVEVNLRARRLALAEGRSGWHLGDDSRVEVGRRAVRRTEDTLTAELAALARAGWTEPSPLTWVVRTFFAQGGQACWVVWVPAGEGDDPYAGSPGAFDAAIERIR